MYIVNKWIISDDYKELKYSPEYLIIVSTKEPVKNYSDFSLGCILTSNLVEKLTMLLKYAIGVSLNSPHNQIFHKRVRAINHREIPKGWEANIVTVDTHLKKTLSSFAQAIPISTNGHMATSALPELHLALNNYDSLDEKIKDLIAVITAPLSLMKEPVI